MRTKLLRKFHKYKISALSEKEWIVKNRKTGRYWKEIFPSFDFAKFQIISHEIGLFTFQSLYIKNRENRKIRRITKFSEL